MVEGERNSNVMGHSSDNFNRSNISRENPVPLKDQIKRTPNLLNISLINDQNKGQHNLSQVYNNKLMSGSGGAPSLLKNPISPNSVVHMAENDRLAGRSEYGITQGNCQGNS